MQREDLIKVLGQYHLQVKEDTELSISRNVVRDPGRRLAAVGCDAHEAQQINGLLDAIHWSKWRLGLDGRVNYSFSGNESVLEALSTLMSAIPPSLEVNLLRELNPVQPTMPYLDADSVRRLEQLRLREQAVVPELHQSIARDIGDFNFRWVRTLTGRTWSGRVDGLRVCELDDDGIGSIGIGQAQRFPVHAHNIPEAVNLLRDYAVARRPGGDWGNRHLEHMLEARVLNGNVRVVIDKQCVTPISWQFPARWSEMGAVRYIDVLGRIDRVPWVIELKVREGGGAGSYFRHAVTQAVLYREFIRRAKGLHPWFVNLGLDPCQCQAVVAFPIAQCDANRRVLEHVTFLADLFSVRVMIINEDWMNIAPPL